MRAADARLAAVIDRVGPCRLRKRRGHFAMLVSAIVGQQVSGAAARTIYGRLCETLGGGAPTAEAVLAASDDALRAAGLSRQKLSYLRDLAEKVDRKQVRLQGLGRLEDEAIVEHLTQVRGIGRWTVEMFLMFVLNRPDVLPVDDLGSQKVFVHVYGLRKMAPTPARMRQLAAPWQPYRTVGAWYLWRCLEEPS